MPRGLNNWTFPDVVRFLKSNDFHNSHIRGSHYYYVKKVGRTHHQVCVPFHGKTSIKPRTMKSIVRQSGISQEAWFNRKRKKK